MTTAISSDPRPGLALPWLLTLILVAGLGEGALAQAPAPPSRAQDAPPRPGQEYVIELKHLRVKYESDGSGERRLKLRVKVLSESAVREWGQLPFPYAPDTEQLQIDRVQVQRPDGTVTVNATGDVQDLAVRPPGDLAALVDLRQKQIAVSALRPGDILDLAVTWKITRRRTHSRPDHRRRCGPPSSAWVRLTSAGWSSWSTEHEPLPSASSPYRTRDPPAGRSSRRSWRPTAA